MRDGIGLGLLLGGMLMVSAVWAANCTGINCRCGDTLVASYTMQAHASCGTSNGIQLASNVTLNCNNYRISGTISGSNQGIRFIGNDAEAINCDVSGFWRGVVFLGDGNTFRGASNSDRSQVYGNGTSTSNGAITMGNGAVGNMVRWTNVHNNHDEGVHFGGGSAFNALQESDVYSNAHEGLYLINTSGNFIANVGVYGGTTRVYLNNAKSNGLSLMYVNGTVHVFQNSDSNTFDWITVDGLFKIQGNGSARPDGNLLENMDLNRSGTVWELSNPGVNNRASYTRFDGSNPDVRCVGFVVGSGTNFIDHAISGDSLQNMQGPGGNWCLRVE